jgi:hypothetical protein
MNPVNGLHAKWNDDDAVEYSLVPMKEKEKEDG